MKKKKIKEVVDRKEGTPESVRVSLDRIADNLDRIAVTLDNVFIEIMKEKALEEMCKDHGDFDFFDK